MPSGGGRIDNLSTVKKYLGRDWKLRHEKPHGYYLKSPKGPKKYIDHKLDSEMAELIKNPDPETPVITETRREVKPPTKASQTLQAFQMLEEGATAIDLMADLDLGFEDVKRVLESYKVLKERELILERMEEKYINAWYTNAKYIGASIRDGCEHFSDDSGTCTLWTLKEIEPAFRRRYPGLVKVVAKRTRYRVMDHPEICCLCKGG